MCIVTERSAQAGSYGRRGLVYSTEEEWRGSEFSMNCEVRLSANGESIGFVGRIEKENKFTRKCNRIAASAMCPFRFVVLINETCLALLAIFLSLDSVAGAEEGWSSARDLRERVEETGLGVLHWGRRTLRSSAGVARDSVLQWTLMGLVGYRF